MALYKCNNVGGGNNKNYKFRIQCLFDSTLSSWAVIVARNFITLDCKYKTMTFDTLTSNVVGQDYAIIDMYKKDGTRLPRIGYSAPVSSLQTIDVTDVDKVDIYLYGKNTGSPWTMLATMDNISFQ